jgi:peptide/nickel transport system substrate-binding protein
MPPVHERKGGLVMRLKRMMAAAVVAATFTAGAQAETLKVGVREFAAGKGNPYSGCICTPSVFVWSAIYEQLTLIDADGDVKPFLTSGWTNTARDTWQFKLRPNVKFSNGEAMNAEAVVAAYEWMATAEGKTTSNGQQYGQFVASVRAVDDLTVEIKTPKPNPILPRNLQSFSIVPKKAWTDQGVAGFTLKPIGTGPYVVEFARDRAIATPYAQSWKPRKNIDRIEIIELPEGPARAQALASAQVDVDVALSRDAIDQVTVAGMRTFTRPSTRTLGISLVSVRKKATGGPSEPSEGPFKDTRVRQAVNYAVDKETIVKNIFRGAGRPASQAATSKTYGYNEAVKPYPHDPDRAKRLLSEAGYPNGFDLEIRAITTDSTIALVYQSAVQDLNKVGVRAKLISQTFADWQKPWLAGDWPWDAFGIGHDLTATMDALRGFDTFSSCLKGNGQAPYYCNQDEMKLIAAAQDEFDPDKRKKILSELLEMNAKNAPILFLVEFDEIMGYSPKIRKFRHINLWIPYDELEMGR